LPITSAEPVLFGVYADDLLSRWRALIFYPSKGKAKDIKSTMTSPHKILGVDLVNIEKHEERGYKYLLNGIDLSTRYLYSIALKNKEKKEDSKG